MTQNSLRWKVNKYSEQDSNYIMPLSIIKLLRIVYHISIIKESHKGLCIVSLIPVFSPFSSQVTELSLFHSKNICISKRTHLGFLADWPKPTRAVDSCVNVLTVSLNICLSIQSMLLGLRGLDREYSCLSPSSQCHRAKHSSRQQFRLLVLLMQASRSLLGSWVNFQT